MKVIYPEIVEADEEEDYVPAPGPCPKCGSTVRWEPDCPGYGKNPVWVCHPVCGNADEYICTNEDCDWWYRTPNNRGSDGMGERPIWLNKPIQVKDGTGTTE